MGEIDTKDILVDLDAVELVPGLQLQRWFKGELHVVDIVSSKQHCTHEASLHGWWRYIYRGKRYKTLSAIAREITGEYRCSGNRFFGLRKRRRGKRK